MLALIIDPHPRVVHDHPEPARATGEAIVQVHTAGVCDTDLQILRGYMSHRGVPGHELVGHVVEADAPGWLGRRVVTDINAGCGHCASCMTEGGHHCATRTVLGIAGRDGAFAERIVMPERCLVPVPDNVDDDRAVFAEPLAAALHVLDEVRGMTSDAVVIGDGKLGLLTAMALVGEITDVTVVGRHRDKLGLAESFGARTCLEAEAPATLRANLVVEASGSVSGLAAALRIVRPKGTIVLKTTTAEAHTIDLAPVVINEIRVVGSRCGDLRRAICVLSKLDPTALIEARYPLSRADDALRHAGRPGARKVLIDVG
jgi:threonine dehydrogenase-like Zn-dependent dehydrogenase